MSEKTNSRTLALDLGTNSTAPSNSRGGTSLIPSGVCLRNVTFVGVSGRPSPTGM